MSWVYMRTKDGDWTVGFFDPNGIWHPESDWDNPDDAAARTHYLNGGVEQGEKASLAWPRKEELPKAGA